ncbi:glycosyltransferase family 2 protein [Vagococcus fluvialis]|uniref:glycosyltransferase family 2 protein n=1 Tax=Vagococcus fluvialis TaxID=2738 RepID=UPI00288CAC08|nr:glycosyltransferase family 2 protein [Vagococcus fluvialis]MDT2782434.1 glycosyltransferase family 2 protein [Vagococcus fluvialis]
MYINKYKVAILMSTYNGEEYISEQIDSIINQSFKDWTLYIRDDGSTDSTRMIITNYVEKFPNIIFINSEENDNLGVIASFYQIVKEVDSDFYMFCDQDDVWLENKILESFNLYNKDWFDMPVVIYSDLELVNHNLVSLGKTMHEQNKFTADINLSNLIAQNSVTGCTVFFNRTLKNKLVLDTNNILMHDWWFALLAITQGKLVFNSNTTILYRQHSNNVVGSKGIIHKLKSGYGLREMKSSIIKTQNQAKSFLECYGEDLSTEDKKIIADYINIYNVSLIDRVKLLKTNKYKKTGFLRNSVFKFLLIFP